MSASNGIRPKIRIRPPKANTESDFTNALAIVNDAVRVIYLKSASLLSFEEIYRNAYFLTLHRRGEVLYRSLIATVRDLLQDRIKIDLGPLVTTWAANPSELPTDQADLFLERVLSIWDHFTMALNLISDVLMYLDKNYLKDKKLPVAWEMGLLQFRDHVLRSSAIAVRPMLRKCLLAHIYAERTGTLAHAALLKRVITMMVDLNDGTSDPLAQRHPTRLFGDDIKPGSVYASDFESYFFEATREHYQIVSSQISSSVDVATYLTQVEQWIRDEEMRVVNYLQPHSRTELLNITQSETVLKHVPYIIAGIEAQLPQAVVDPANTMMTLRRAYSLFSNVQNGLPLLQKAVTDMIERFGQDGAFTNNAEITQESTTNNGDPGSSERPVSSPKINDADKSALNDDAMKWVCHITALLKLSNKLLNECFKNDPNFERGMHTSETIVINHESKAAEYLSVYLDYHLRRGIKISETETESNIKNALNVFNFIQNKDIFQRNYNQKLARRLLKKLSSSDEHENMVISELRNVCGSQFTLQFEKMIQDIHMSTEMSRKYDAERRVRSRLAGSWKPVGFSINILTAAMWPITNEGISCLYPKSIEKLKTEFEEYYCGIHANRTIKWCSSLETADMTAYYKKGRKELSVTSYAMIVLMKYNERDVWTYEELLAETQIPDGELKRTLLSISVGKLSLLLKHPAKSKHVDMKDTFAFNTEFSDKRTKIKVQMIMGGHSKMEVDQERQMNNTYVEEERKGLTDAAIVRVMKSRQRIEHNELVIQVSSLLKPRFNPLPQMIKHRIEALIDREYMERSGADSKVYTYIA